MKGSENYIVIFKENLNKCSNFIDYFLAIGIKPEIFLNDFLYNTDIEELNSIYQSHFIPTIITKFPPIEKKAIDIDDTITQYCFPQGFKIIQSERIPEPEIFSFVLDNQIYSINYPQKYISCCIFYESINDYRTLLNKYEKSSRKPDDPVDDDENRNNTNDSSIAQSSSGSAGNLINQNIPISKQKKIFINERNKSYYIPKCILLASLYPFFSEFEHILKELYQYSLNEHYIPIYKIIESYVLEIPVPPRGIFTIEYTDTNSNSRLIKQNKMNELPLIHLNLRMVFDKFSVDNIIRIMSNLLLETKIIFFSSECWLLTPFIYGLTSLIYPLQYQYSVVTILPKNSFTILESISPFIIGINDSYSPDFFENNELNLSDTQVLIVDIDKSKLHYLASNDNSNDNDNKEVSIPSGLKNKLEKPLNYLMAQYKKANSNSNNHSNDNSYPYDKHYDFYPFNQEIRFIFFNFISILLENYSRYLNYSFLTSNHHPNLEALFKVQEFLDSLSANDKPFYHKFITQTQTFPDFIYKKMIPKDSHEKLQILQFDEKIDQNTTRIFSKARLSIYTNSKGYNFINTIRVVKPRQLSKEEILYYSNEKDNTFSLLKKGVIVTPVSSKANCLFKFNTPLFPLLMTDQFSHSNYNDYFYPSFLMEEIESINSEIASKTQISNIDINIKQTDMENYIYLCWVQLWAMAFWAVEKIEKNYRFQQLLIILSSMRHHEIEVFNLLFETLSKYGDSDMIIRLYDFLIKQGIHPSCKIHTIVMKLIDKNRNSSSHEELHQMIQQFPFCIDDNLKKPDNLRRRTLKSKYHPNLINENIIFYAFYICLECSLEINLLKLNTQFNEMSRDALWGKCIKCKYPFMPKLSVQLGDEINKKGLLKLNTSSFDSFVLYSPLFLKINYNNCLLKDFGIKMDLEEFTQLKYNGLFWSSIWYFKIKDLPYDMFLPYVKSPNIACKTEATQHLNVSTITISQLNEKAKENKGCCVQKIKKRHKWNQHSFSIQHQTI